MTMFQMETTQIIDAPAEAIYAVLADYHVGHNAILPRPYFQEMTVLEGGHGAGTRLRIKMKILGKEYTFNQIVSEPEPGRIIKDTDIHTGEGAAFILDPIGDGQRTKVTILSEFIKETGFAGIMQRLITPPISRFVLKKELRNLAEYVANQAQTNSVATS